jgi:hypothetical protein
MPTTEDAMATSHHRFRTNSTVSRMKFIAVIENTRRREQW